MKQLTFPHPMYCTHIYRNGNKERVRYGQYESIMIVEENGWPVNRTMTLTIPSWFVEDVTKVDGTIVVFSEPFYKTDKGRDAPF